MLVLAVLVGEHLRRRPAAGLRPARPDPDGALTMGLAAFFAIKRLASAIVVLFAGQHPDVPHLRRDPQRRPRAAAGRPHGHGRRHRHGAPRVRLRQADLGAVLEDRCSRSSTARSSRYTQHVTVFSQIKRGLPATLSLAIGAAIIWMVVGVHLRRHRRAAGRQVLRRRHHDRQLRRHLGADVRGRRDPALLPDLQGDDLPGRRLRRRSPAIRCSGSSIWSCRGSRSPSSTSASTRKCCAPACWTP